MLRRMRNEFEGITFYESSFDQATGTLIRVVEVPEGGQGYVMGDSLAAHLADRLEGFRLQRAFEERWHKRFSWGRRDAFSPSPETVDVSITNHCSFGCSYCYMDSIPTAKHAPASHVADVIKAFAEPPYQVAIGGGEPTGHPDLPKMLYEARELGTVPNYTTAGHIFREDVIEATNNACGGVSMTFHAFKGMDYFIEHYKRLRRALKVQMNVHLIADKDAAINLDLLREAQEKVGKLRIVLLAFYPDVGRADLMRIMPKSVYEGTFPEALERAVDDGMKIAFSEGLLPYFLSRPELGVDTRFAARSEGLFSCYVDTKGRLSESSFSPPEPGDQVALAAGSLQGAWEQLSMWGSRPHGGKCSDCRLSDRCSTPSVHHYFACSFAEHNGNNPPLSDRALRELETRRVMDAAHAAYEAKEVDLGRELLPNERDAVFKSSRRAARVLGSATEPRAVSRKVSLKILTKDRTGP
jgi:hypothetical protein